MRKRTYSKAKRKCERRVDEKNANVNLDMQTILIAVLLYLKQKVVWKKEWISNESWTRERAFPSSG